MYMVIVCMNAFYAMLFLYQGGVLS